ncbi:hypothetical protein [Roseburia hominis]|uniref:hypothetical protein n=1 Tax=Roseburia hominis TaxID=301301 RepID=UPI0026E99CE3|nr:hypothetical protein [Roseburia hominis]
MDSSKPVMNSGKDSHELKTSYGFRNPVMNPANPVMNSGKDSHESRNPVMNSGKTQS